jgi:hypothetical protein
MTDRARCPDCSATFSARDEQRGKSIRCPKCQRIFNIPAVQTADYGADESFARDGVRRRSASVVDRRDEADGARTTSRIKQTAYRVGQARPESQAGGVPTIVIGVVAAAALVLGLAVGGGVAYLNLRPVGSPGVGNMRPAQPDRARDGRAIGKQPDAPLFAHGHDPNRMPDGQAPQKEPDPPLVARLQDPKRMPEAAASEKQPDLQLARAAEARVQANVPPGGEAAQKQRWEYLVVTLPADNNNATDQMNRLAGEGWEYLGLINTSIPGSSGVFEPHQNRIVGASRGHESSILLRRLKIPSKWKGLLRPRT